jgi:hypothetical protein
MTGYVDALNDDAAGYAQSYMYKLYNFGMVEVAEIVPIILVPCINYGIQDSRSTLSYSTFFKFESMFM